MCLRYLPRPRNRDFGFGIKGLIRSQKLSDNPQLGTSLYRVECCTNVVLPQPLPGSPLTTSPHGAGPVRLLALSARLWSQPTYFTSSHACLYRWDLLPSLVHLRGIS